MKRFLFFLFFLPFCVFAMSPHDDDVRRALFYSSPVLDSSKKHEVFYTYEYHKNKQQMRVNTGETLGFDHSNSPWVNLGGALRFKERWTFSVWGSLEFFLDFSVVSVLQYDFIKGDKYKLGVFAGYGGSWIVLWPRYGGGLIGSVNLYSSELSSLNLFATSQVRSWKQKFQIGRDEGNGSKRNKVFIELVTWDSHVGFDYLYKNIGIRPVVGLTDVLSSSVSDGEFPPTNYKRSDELYFAVTVYLTK